MNIKVGDVLEFPKHKESTVIRANTGSVMLSQGAPGKFKVKSIEPDGTIKLEKLPDER